MSKRKVTKQVEGDRLKAKQVASFAAQRADAEEERAEFVARESRKSRKPWTIPLTEDEQKSLIALQDKVRSFYTDSTSSTADNEKNWNAVCAVVGVVPKTPSVGESLTIMMMEFRDRAAVIDRIADKAPSGKRGPVLFLRRSANFAREAAAFVESALGYTVPVKDTK